MAADLDPDTFLLLLEELEALAERGLIERDITGKYRLTSETQRLVDIAYLGRSEGLICEP